MRLKGLHRWGRLVVMQVRTNAQAEPAATYPLMPQHILKCKGQAKTNLACLRAATDNRFWPLARQPCPAIGQAMFLRQDSNYDHIPAIGQAMFLRQDPHFVHVLVLVLIRVVKLNVALKMIALNVALKMITLNVVRKEEIIRRQD